MTTTRCANRLVALGVLATPLFLMVQPLHAQDAGAKVGPVLFTEKDPLFSAAKSLENWWPGDGHALDLVGNRHAALKDGACFGPGRVGKAFSFDGARSVVELGKPKAPNLSTPEKAFTLMFWFRAQEQPSWQYLAFCWGNRGMDINISELHPGRVAGQLGEGEGYGDTFGKTWSNASANFHPFDQWHHLAFTFDGTHARLYRNGTMASETPWKLYAPSDTPLLLGGQDRNIGVTSFKGQIEDVALFNRGLSAEEVGAVYEAETAPVPVRITDGELQKFDAVLEAKPAPLAWYAAMRLPSDVAAGREHFRKGMPSTTPDDGAITDLIKGLDADSYAERERATAALGAYGAAVKPALRAALERNPDPEVASRIQDLLAAPDTGDFAPNQVYAARIAAILNRVNARLLQQAGDTLP